MLGQQREHIMEKKQNEATYSQQAPPSNGKRKIKCKIKDAAYYEAQARKIWGSDPYCEAQAISREEHVNVMGMPYAILIFRISNNDSESLFEEEPSEVYFEHHEQAKLTFDKLVANSVESATCSHIILMKHGMGGNPEDGDALDDWDETD